MSLNYNELKSKINTDFKKPNSSAFEAASKLSTAFETYIMKAQDVGGGIAISISGISALRSQLKRTFQSQKSSKQLIAEEIASAFKNCLMTLQTTYIIRPVITDASYSVFSSNLKRMFNKDAPSSNTFAINFSKHIHTFVTSSQIQGMIPGSPPYYFTGPIS